MSLISAFRPPSARSETLHRRPRHRRRHRSPNSGEHTSPETEDGLDTYADSDAHSIITPSKHTPKPLRILKNSISAGGPIRPFRLLRQDLHHIRQRYVSDWTLFNQLIFASAVYVFFTNLLPGITFASDLYVLTGESWGTIEVVLSTGVCGIIFSLFSIQPLTILGVTGPFSVLAENIYSLCENSFRIPFLPFMAWSLIHAAWMHYILAIINAHDWTMRYVTTFSTEIFSLLNSVIYFHKAIQELERAHSNLSFAAFLYAVIGAVGTMLVAIFLSTAESWKPHFHRYVRLGLREYAAAISIILFIGLPHVGELADLDRTTLHVSTSFEPTSPDRDVFFVEFWKLPLQWVFIAIIPALIITMLFFFDHEVSSIICTIDRYGTRKPGGFAWDIILLGTTTALCGILGIPPANGLLPQAPLHSESLMHIENEEVSIIIDGEERAETQEVRRVHEQRWSSLLHAVGILLFVSPPFMKVLGLTPTSVLAGLFLFMGEQSLSVNPILYRMFYLLTPPSELPPLPPSVGPPSSSSSSSKDPNRPSYKPVHLYTLLQIILTTAVFILTLTPAAPAFPVLIIALVPFRLFVMKHWWRSGALRFLDAWACRVGTPEDDEESKASPGDDGGAHELGETGLGRSTSGQAEDDDTRRSGEVRNRPSSYTGEDSDETWIELGLRTPDQGRDVTESSRNRVSN